MKTTREWFSFLDFTLTLRETLNEFVLVLESHSWMGEVTDLKVGCCTFFVVSKFWKMK
jgi:hypothetical protein